MTDSDATMMTKEIKDYRLAQLKRQRHKCPLCGERIEEAEATLDHCHVTGHVRKVLHRSCNAAEGKILHWAKVRSRGDDHILFLRNLIKYWKSDFSDTPVHPTHGKPRKRRPRRKR